MTISIIYFNSLRNRIIQKSVRISPSHIGHQTASTSQRVGLQCFFVTSHRTPYRNTKKTPPPPPSSKTPKNDIKYHLPLADTPKLSRSSVRFFLGTFNFLTTIGTVSLIPSSSWSFGASNVDPRCEATIATTLEAGHH